ncbi:pseudouridine-5'-phosphate glycosidase [Fervidobacterium nodosum]|uniref:Pseudouridine-5'-phosphate glycosidase n=1 Tax=Fervidobacterium nodosum (strain ATCC 35602 / DSM 5306 / Rt17-B1) TaxID=381764 RepID=PSUG_FERNB|nr:pseudouridine-5'-phosphate glycosidase [Fervidobacterium nodosum]A7HMA1.1 RecName: Full=Pseudouridine-5'-phosphate glycosidase; Short=PsiMP glycosidase [Fervidobacterium nodosum Rt17-B1]ABS61034.1 Indigoidine synthase A family protein [Fervidobacterium nodosum Rt17-B1]
MIISEKVKKALEDGIPVIALESTVIAHGLPYPHNVETAKMLEEMALENGVVPATIGILKGEIIVGMSQEQINEMLADEPLKIGTREIPYAVGMKKSAATTVSATMRIAKIAGIDVFATGGIGGVHIGDWDVSQDITEMAKSDVIVVSAGCKSILDVKKTIEFLETFQVTVVGYKTNKFPIFYEGLSDFNLEHRVDSPEDIAKIFRAKKSLGIEGALLVANPIPQEFVISEQEVDGYMKQALSECFEKGITGKAVTPYLLSRIAQLSNGKTLTSNIELLKNNVLLACQIAKSLKTMA